MLRAIVVGAGLVGTLHAVEARRRGWEVLHFEIDPEPQYASVRHLGGLRVGDRPAGVALETALRARQLWFELAARAPGIGLRADGSLTLATEASHLDLFRERLGAPDAGRRRLQFLPPEAVRALEPSLRGPQLGALRCGLDATIEPRSTVRSLRDQVLEGDGYRFLGGRQVWDVGPGRVVDTAGRVHTGDLVLVCTGARTTVLTGMLTARAPLRRVRVQLLQTARFGGTLRSLLVHAGHSDPTVEDLDVELVCARRSSGGLTVGRSAEHEEPFPFDLPERPLAWLTAQLAELLGGPLPPVVRRWEATYHCCTDGRVWYREPVDEGVVVVTGAGEEGATLAPAIAEDTFDWLEHGLDRGGSEPTGRRGVA